MRVFCMLSSWTLLNEFDLWVAEDWVAKASLERSLSTWQTPNPWLAIRLRWAALVGNTLHILTNTVNPYVTSSSQLSLQVVLGIPNTIITENVNLEELNNPVNDQCVM